MSEERKVLVLWADEKSTNFGVQALAHGTRKLVQLLLPEASVTFKSYGDFGDDGIRLGLKSIASSYFSRRSRIGDWLRDFDLVIDTGAGDSFADIYGVRRHVEMSLLRGLAGRHGVPLIMGPQTVGPFERPGSRQLAAWSVKAASGVIARDQVSAKRASEIYHGRVFEGSDVAFLLDPPIDGPVIDVALNVSGLLWNPNPHVDSKFYREAIIALVRELAQMGRRPVLVSHVLASETDDNDVIAIRGLQQLIGDSIQVVIPQNLYEARQALGNSKVVVASRMHAALNSLSSGVPAISWAYSRKFEPLMSGLGWNYVYDLRLSDFSIVESTIRAVEELADSGREVENVRKLAVERLSTMAELIL